MIMTKGMERNKNKKKNKKKSIYNNEQRNDPRIITTNERESRKTRKSFIHFQFTATPPDEREATAFNNCSRRSCTPWLLFPEEEDEEDTETVAGVEVPPSFFPAEEEEKEGGATEAAGMRAAFSPLRPMAPLKEEEEEACPPLFPF
jgi:hypothetical protein